ncbi:MAG TPA: cytochrome c oxidase subunit II [Anaerolineales bacterium]|nr:cytochrome c oxidase subunit II [Anaerolineales bacterium]
MKSLKRIVWLAGPALTLAGCATSPTFLHSNSSIAGHQAALYRDVLIEAAFIFVLITGVLVWMLIRGAGAARQPGLANQTHGKLSWAVTAAVLVLIADGVDFGMMANTMKHIAIPAPAAEDVQVNVIGHRWWWEFDYPQLGIKTANELHIPTGANVHITLTSVDVIHSFWAPQLAGKTDAIPGQSNHMWLRADEPGVFAGQCSEFCGTEHALMRLEVVADTPADFQTWVAHQQEPAAAPQTEQEQAGYKILTTTCGTCHSLDPADPRPDLTGPNLAHLYSRRVFAGATFKLTPDNIRLWVQDTQAMKPGNDMNINLRTADLDAVVAYLQLLR